MPYDKDGRVVYSKYAGSLMILKWVAIGGSFLFLGMMMLGKL